MLHPLCFTFQAGPIMPRAVPVSMGLSGGLGGGLGGGLVRRSRGPGELTMLASPPSPSWIIGSVAAGALPAIFVVRNLEPWYAGLKKPTWSPPDRIFAPVWSSLYALIGLSCSLVFGSKPWTPAAFRLFVLQAVINLSWAPVFFEAHKIRLGALVSAVM